MKNIPKNKIELYLKLGRRLASFVKIDSYFESRTFDWIRLVKNGSSYKATLIRSFDQGDEFFNDIAEFDTLNELDEIENKFLVEDFEIIEQWLLEEFNLTMDDFLQMKDLKTKYLELVRENKLGSQLNDEHIEVV